MNSERKKEPRVSVITPCLNNQATIRQTIESVLNQTYSDIEYIIVDGKSSDGTVGIIKEYIPLFNGRLKYISEKDSGIYDAMNKGLRLSTGSLIGIINSDDYYEKNAVENIVAHMTDGKYQVIYGYCRLIKNNHITGILKNRHENLSQGMIPHPTCFVTRKIYCDFGMFLTTFRIAGDYELMVRIFQSRQVKFTQVRQIIANFRLGGICSNTKQAKRENAIIAYYYRMISLKDLLMNLASIYV